MISPNKAHQTLAIFDVDGTLIEGQTQKMFLDILREEGIVSFVDFLLLSLWFVAYKLHVVKNTDTIRHQAYRKLVHKKTPEIETIIEKYFHRFQEKMFLDARKVIQQHQRSGHDILLCSASIEPIIRRISQEFHIKTYLCTELEIVENTFTGNIKGHALYGSQKYLQLHAYLQQHHYQYTFYYTDHISDLDILELVNIPICINPDPRLRAIATIKKWEIRDWV